MKFSFFLPMLPPTVTHQQKQIRVIKGKPIVYEPARLAAARNKLEAYLSRYVPKTPAQGPVQLLVKWCFPITGKHQDGDWKITKPDTDNLQKLLKDCMTKLGYWKDDAQVASEIIEKFWAVQPGIYIAVQEMEDNV